MELLVGAGQRHKYRNLRKLCDFASRFQTLTLTPIWTWQCDMALVAGGKSEGRGNNKQGKVQQNQHAYNDRITLESAH